MGSSEKPLTFRKPAGLRIYKDLRGLELPLDKGGQSEKFPIYESGKPKNPPAFAWCLPFCLSTRRADGPGTEAAGGT